MNIILYTLIFPPDTCSNSYIFSDLALEFKKRGHNVSVVTTTPHYDEFNAEQKTKELIKSEKKWFFKSDFFGIPVYHIKVGLKKGNFFQRIKTFYAFQFKALKLIKTTKIKADVVYCQTPPMTIGFFANKISKYLGAKSVFINQDLWLDAIYKKKKIGKNLYKILSRFEKKEMISSTYVTSISDYMKNEIERKLNNKKKVCLVPNFANTELYKPVFENYRQRYNLSDSDFVVSYVGNIGKAQNLNPLIEIALKFPNVKILLAGNGTELEKYTKTILDKNINNIQYLGYVSREESVIINSVSDLCCILLGQHVVNTSFPSKVYTIMACGKPCFVSSNISSEVYNFVSKSDIGYCTNVNDTDNVLNTINYCIHHKDELKKRGDNGLALVKTKYSVGKVADMYLDLLKVEER